MKISVIRIGGHGYWAHKSNSAQRYPKQRVAVYGGAAVTPKELGVEVRTGGVFVPQCFHWCMERLCHMGTHTCHSNMLEGGKEFGNSFQFPVQGEICLVKDALKRCTEKVMRKVMSEGRAGIKPEEGW